MSEQTPESVAQTVESSASTETTPTLSQSDLDFKRDMFKFKEEAKSLREEKAAWQLEQEQKKGNLTSVIDTLKSEIKTLKHGNATDKLSFADTQIESAIKTELMSRGVKDVDVFMKLIDDNDKSIVELDDRFNVNTEDTKNIVDKNMERYGHIFKKSVNVVDATPNNKPMNQPVKGFDLNGASAAETLDYLLKNQDRLK
jgi:hypothetical protein